MTPREKEIALEAAGRSSDPVEHAKKMLEAEAFLRGERPPFVVWSRGAPEQPLSARLRDNAAWLEAQAAVLRQRADEQFVHEIEVDRRIAVFRQRGQKSELETQSPDRSSMPSLGPEMLPQHRVSVPPVLGEGPAENLRPHSAPEPG